MKAYKIFNSDWTCRDFQYKLGETFTLDGKLEICKNGLHACEELSQCYKYYDNIEGDKYVCEVELLGDIIQSESKDEYATNKIKIIKELNQEEIEDNFRKNEDDVNWGWISICQKLSTNFIREFKKKFDWYYISIYQKLSEQFIREFENSVDWVCVSKYQILSEQFKEEFKHRINSKER